jgi:hypothetical protein
LFPFYILSCFTRKKIININKFIVKCERKKILSEGNQIHHLISSSGSGTVIDYGYGSDFLTSYSSGSGSTRQKVMVPTVPVPQHLAAGIVDTGGKFATGVNNTRGTGGKICHRCL